MSGLLRRLQVRLLTISKKMKGRYLEEALGL